MQTSSSSLFVHTISIILWFVLSVAAGILGFDMAAAFLMFMFLLSLFAKLWSKAALKKVKIELQGTPSRLFHGDEARLTYSVTNGKFLPLIWLDVIQQLPTSKCLMPLNDEGVEEVKSVDGRDRNEVLERLTNQLYQVKDDTVPVTFTTTYRIRRRFSFILWHQTLSWQTIWTARKRGIYQIKDITLVSGDGLGLSQREYQCALSNIPTFAVYPKLQPVNSEPFMRTLWSSRSGAKGFMEDNTVIRSNRDYQHGDPWKRINWRMVARGQDLQVDVYDTVLPKSAHFILDGESFRQENSEENQALEDTISIIASLLLELSAAGVDCSLSMPKSRNFAACNLSPRQGDSVDDMLFNLAGYEYYEPDVLAGEIKVDNPPSVFDFSHSLFTSEDNGRSYYFCYDANKVADWSFLEEAKNIPLTVLSYVNVDFAALSAVLEVPVSGIESIKRG